MSQEGVAGQTMAFKASPEIAKSVKAGDNVTFDLNLGPASSEKRQRRLCHTR